MMTTTSLNFQQKLSDCEDSSTVQTIAKSEGARYEVEVEVVVVVLNTTTKTVVNEDKVTQTTGRLVAKGSRSCAAE